MKLQIVNEIVETVGVDKALHFLVGGYVTAIMSLFGWFGLILGIASVCLLSFYKEKTDSVFDIKDIYAALSGVGFTTFVYLLAAL